MCVAANSLIEFSFIHSHSLSTVDDEGNGQNGSDFTIKIATTKRINFNYSSIVLSTSAMTSG